MRPIATLALALAVVVPQAAAETKFDPDARARTIAPFLDDQAIVVGHVVLTRVDVDAVMAQVARALPAEVKDITQAEPMARRWVADFTRAGGKEIYLVVGLADLRHPSFVIVPLEDGADAGTLGNLFGARPTGAVGSSSPGPLHPPAIHSVGPKSGSSPAGRGPAGPSPFEVSAILDHVCFAGPPAALSRLRGLKPTPRPDLARAFAAAGDTPAQLLILPTADMRRVVEEMIPALPQEIGDGPSTIITRGLLWAAVGVAAAPNWSFNLVIQSQDPAAAKGLSGLIGNVWKALGRNELVRRFVPNFNQVAAHLTPTVAGDRLTLTLGDTDQALADLMAIRRIIPLAMSRTICINNLKQIGLALHNYRDTFNRFPAAARYDKQGRPLLSWRVLILPYLDQGSLYREFHLDEPWDSAHNRKLIARMPAVYHCPRQRPGMVGKTTYLAPRGAATMFPGHKSVSIQEVTDGTSLTIFIVDANDDRAVIWTRPDDLAYDPKHPLAGLVGHHPGGFLALFVDGSVHFIPETVAPATLRALFTRNGGERVPVPFP